MRKSHFKNKILLNVLILPLILSLTGCVYLVVGGIGAVGGYVVSPDTVEGISGYDSVDLWDTTTEIISIMGLIEEGNEEGGMIIAKVSGAKVTIVITPITPSTTKLTVKARKGFVPKISVAQDVFVKIMSHLKEEE